MAACGTFTPPQWLFKAAGCWQELEAAAINLHPERPKHAQWVTCPVSRLAMWELRVATTCTHFLEACADCCNMGPCISTLQHEVMVTGEGRDNRPQDPINISHKQYLCLWIPIGV